MLVTVLLWVTPAGAQKSGFRDIYPEVREGVVLLLGDLGRGKVSTGTGFVVASDGGSCLALTNAHVVEGAGRLKAVINNKRQVSAEVIARDRDHDLALCRIYTSGLPVLPFAQERSLEGTEIAVVGYPYTQRFTGAGMEVTATVTRGIISAHRAMKGKKGEIYQIDADVNPGNSGGPVFDWETGAVIGVTVFKMNDAAGLNFAIPESLALAFLAEEKVTPRWAGQTRPATPLATPTARLTPTPEPARASKTPDSVPVVLAPSGSPRRTETRPVSRAFPSKRKAPDSGGPKFPWAVLIGLGLIVAAAACYALTLLFGGESRSRSRARAPEDDLEL